jgi:hypothetical protein
MYVLLGGTIVMAMSPDDLTALPEGQGSLAASVAGAVHWLEAPGLPCRRLWSLLPTAIHELFFFAHGQFSYFPEAFSAVHEANMGKLWPADSNAGQILGHLVTYAGDNSGRYIVKRPDGKIVKPPTFNPPNLSRFFLNAQEEKPGPCPCCGAEVFKRQDGFYDCTNLDCGWMQANDSLVLYVTPDNKRSKTIPIIYRRKTD